jgi:cytochrome c oxidase assembly factor CtaG
MLMGLAAYHGAAYHGAFYHLAAYHGTAGYHGPPELTPWRAVSEWTLDPWALVVIAGLTLAYLAGVRRVRRAGQPWPVGRVIACCGLGSGFAIIATMSFLRVYQPVLFYARAAQTIVLLLVIPLLWALGRPVSLAIAALPAAGRRIEAVIGSRAARLVTFPAITTLVLVVTPFLVYFTSWYAAGFSSGLVRELTYLALLVPGFVFFWTLLRIDPVPKAYPYVVSLWISGAEVIGDAILGLAIIADPHLIAAAYYHLVARPWGPSLATDQVLGGGTIWVLGDIVGLPFLMAQLIQMIREDEADAKVIDAELDAVAAAAAVAVAAGPGQEAGAGEETRAGQEAGAGRSAGACRRPWWESDPRFAGRFQPVSGSVAAPDQERPA